jgi:outer membrane protein assembly factor BamB
MHPGGTVLSVAAFGDVVVATTSRREVVAYSDAGVRLWSLRLEDVAFWSPARIDDRRVAVADAAGSVRAVDLLTGVESWRAGVGTQVSGPLVASAETVVVADAGGATTALAAGTGEERWSVDVPVTRAALFGETLVISNAATLEALDLRTGRRRWLLPQTGTINDLQPFGDTLVAATQLGTVVIDEQGTVTQRLPAYERLTVAGDTIVGWGPTQAEFRDDEWTVRAIIDTPDVNLSRSLPATLAYRQGVLVFDRNWTFSSWSDEP